MTEKNYKVRFQASFESLVIGHSDPDDAASDVDIPENATSRYLPNTFEVLEVNETEDTVMEHHIGPLVIYEVSVTELRHDETKNDGDVMTFASPSGAARAFEDACSDESVTVHVISLTTDRTGRFVHTQRGDWKHWNQTRVGVAPQPFI